MQSEQKEQCWRGDQTPQAAEALTGSIHCPSLRINSIKRSTATWLEILRSTHSCP